MKVKIVGNQVNKERKQVKRNKKYRVTTLRRKNRKNKLIINKNRDRKARLNR